MNIETGDALKILGGIVGGVGAAIGGAAAGKIFVEKLFAHWLAQRERDATAKLERERAERDHEQRFLVAFEKNVAQTARFSDVLGAIEATQRMTDMRLDRIEGHLGIQIPATADPRVTLTGSYPAVSQSAPLPPAPPVSPGAPGRPSGG